MAMHKGPGKGFSRSEGQLLEAVMVRRCRRGSWEVPWKVKSHFIAFGLSPRFTEQRARYRLILGVTANWTVSECSNV